MSLRDSHTRFPVTMLGKGPCSIFAQTLRNIMCFVRLSYLQRVSTDKEEPYGASTEGYLNRRLCLETVINIIGIVPVYQVFVLSF